MRLTCFLIAEFASVSNDGKLVIAGVFDNMEFQRVAGAPPEAKSAIPLRPAYLVAQVEFSIAEGLRHVASLRILDDDNHEVAPSVRFPAIDLKMNPFGRPMRMNMVVQIAALALPGAGDYTFELSIDGTRIGETPFYLTDVTP